MATKEQEEELEAELDAAAAEAEGDEEDESEIGDASDRLRPQVKKGRPGRKRKRVNGNGEGNVTKSSHLSEGTDTRSQAIASKDAAVIWDAVLEQARRDNRPPALVGISVLKLGIGAYPSEAQNMNMINGDLVCGDEHTSPGDALVRYITDVYHIPTSDTPKLYKLSFHYRTGTRNQIQSPVAELRLAAPQEILAQRAAEERFRQQKAINDAVKNVRGSAGVGAVPMQPPYVQPNPGYPQPGYPMQQQPYPYYPPPPMPQGGSEQMEAMRREVAAVMGAMNERARLEGLIPPPAPIAPPVPQISAEEQAARTAQVVAQVLTGMGFTPALAAKLNSPQLSAQAVQQSVADPMEGAKAFFRTLREFRQMDAEMREEFAPEPEEEKKPAQLPPMDATKVEVDKTALKPMPLAGALFGGKVPNYGEKGEDEALASYITRIALGNPEIALGFVEKLSNSALAKALPAIVQKLVGAGLPAVAAAVQAKQMNGAPQQAVETAHVVQAPVASWGPPKV